jgi:hypothetical protein
MCAHIQNHRTKLFRTWLCTALHKKGATLYHSQYGDPLRVGKRQRALTYTLAGHQVIQACAQYWRSYVSGRAFSKSKKNLRLDFSPPICDCSRFARYSLGLFRAGNIFAREAGIQKTGGSGAMDNASYLGQYTPVLCVPKTWPPSRTCSRIFLRSRRFIKSNARSSSERMSSFVIKNMLVSGSSARKSTNMRFWPFARCR